MALPKGKRRQDIEAAEVTEGPSVVEISGAGAMPFSAPAYTSPFAPDQNVEISPTVGETRQAAGTAPQDISAALPSGIHTQVAVAAHKESIGGIQSVAQALSRLDNVLGELRSALPDAVKASAGTPLAEVLSFLYARL